LIVESSQLAIGGTLLGLVIAHFTLSFIEKLAPPALLPATIGIDLRVLGFALGVSVLTTLVVGLWPAFRATHGHLARSLRDGGRSGSGGRAALRARRVLVVAETSLALVLLVCAALVVQSLRHLVDIDPGFVADHVVTMRVSLPAPRYSDTTQVAFFRDLQSRLEGRGGIESVAAANTPPISGGGIVTGIRLMGMSRPADEKLSSPVTAVTPGYFRTLGIRVLQGRDVAWSDVNATMVASQSAAKKYWPGESPIGKRVAFGRDSIGLEIVGIVNDTRARGLTTEVPPMLYMHYAGATSVARTMSIVVKGRGDLQQIVAETRRTTAEIDRSLPLYNVMPVNDLIEVSIGQPRLNTTLLTAFAVVALVLAVIGIYGVISYSVTQRTQEIGVRVALGAQAGDVVRLVLREGAGLATTGVLLGVGGALLATPLIQSWLYGIEKGDPKTIVAMAAGLVAVALAASYLPARRAARVDPLVAMRAD
jgi:predicted permease